MSQGPRIIVILAVGVLCTVGVAHAEFRPALVGNGPKALVNQIKTQKVAAKTQGGAIVMFKTFVDENGKPHGATTYRSSGDSNPLAAEVRNAIERSRFIPAVYNGRPIGVYFAGTAVFLNADGKPRLRILANQNSEDIKRLSDFVAPQLVAGTANWNAAKVYLERARIFQRNGAVELSVSVDTNGKVRDLKVLSEDPPDFDFRPRCPGRIRARSVYSWLPQWPAGCVHLQLHAIRSLLCGADGDPTARIAVSV
ncbi:MAG: hypothetical protein H0X73_03490 [Chthoniobacterales bacterium]|nr:hypothetical protein [Chthoniobacterales bacterium]